MIARLASLVAMSTLVSSQAAADTTYAWFEEPSGAYRTYELSDGRVVRRHEGALVAVERERVSLRLETVSADAWECDYETMTEIPSTRRVHGRRLLAVGSTTSRPATPPRPIHAAHDRLRAMHCAPPMRWSERLETSAQAWADELVARGCAFEHSRGPYGENLAAGTAGHLDAEAVAQMWYREVADYDFARGGFSMQTGHFTQLVWVGTTELGCGRATCNGLDVWVCQYGPPGNVEGQYRQNVLSTSCR